MKTVDSRTHDATGAAEYQVLDRCGNARLARERVGPHRHKPREDRKRHAAQGLQRDAGARRAGHSRLADPLPDPGRKTRELRKAPWSKSTREPFLFVNTSRKGKEMKALLIGMESLPGTPKMREPPSNALGHREPSGMRRGLRCFQRADGAGRSPEKQT